MENGTVQAWYTTMTNREGIKKVKNLCMKSCAIFLSNGSRIQ